MDLVAAMSMADQLEIAVVVVSMAVVVVSMVVVVVEMAVEVVGVAVVNMVVVVVEMTAAGQAIITAGQKVVVCMDRITANSMVDRVMVIDLDTMIATSLVDRTMVKVMVDKSRVIDLTETTIITSASSLCQLHTCVSDRNYFSTYNAYT